MPNKIVLKKSSVASKVPLVGDLDYGELAINYADGKLFYKDVANNIKSLTPSATDISNWNTAYGWGNHATVGYLTSAAIGTTVQAYDVDLTEWASVSTSSKQDTLISGTNIKTINGNSLLGSGDIAISGGSAISVSDEGTQITAGVTSLNFTGAGVTATASGNNVTLAITSGGISSADIQEFSTVGTSTWTKPAGAKIVEVLVIGAGGGGGGGRRRSTTEGCSGGAGGGGGGVMKATFPASVLASTVSVVVGAGGTGRTGGATAGTNGLSGLSGGATNFGGIVNAIPGGGGYGGGTTTSTQGTSGYTTSGEAESSFVARGGGGSLINNGTFGFRGGIRPGGGGSGSGFAQSTSVAGAGGIGGAGGAMYAGTSTTLTTGGGGASGAAPGGNGGLGQSPTNPELAGSGGGGGGSDPAGGGGNGGNGGYPGGGGGGGGCGGAAPGGNGGNGGDGYVRVITYF